RSAIGHQYGGETASHSGQGHEASVHFITRLIDDFARPRHGEVAPPLPRAAPRRGVFWGGGICAPREARPVGVPEGTTWRLFFWLPAEPADTCFPPKRSRTRSDVTASPRLSPPMTVRNGTARPFRPAIFTSSPARPCVGVIRCHCCAQR